MGQNFSKTLYKTPWLPLAPTDGCTATNLTEAADWMNTTMTYVTTSTPTTPLETKAFITDQCVFYIDLIQNRGNANSRLK